MAHASSIGMPRMRDGDATSRRRLRLRGDARSHEMMRSDGDGDIALLEVPSREPVAIGETVRIEISLGALTDEVELDGRVESVRSPGDAGPPIVVIRLTEEHRPRARYVRAVLSGARAASARGHRRIPTDLPCTWSQGPFAHDSRIRDLSRGGAYVVSHLCPEVGSRVEVVLDVGGPRLRLDASVTWVRAEGRLAGFGVSFKLRDRRAAEQLFAVLREQERSVGVR